MFLPNQLIFSFVYFRSGHSKGVAAIRLFPKSGHLLLSASMDCKIKVKGYSLVLISCSII